MVRPGEQQPQQQPRGFVRAPISRGRSPEPEPQLEEEEEEIDIREERPSGYRPAPPLTKSGRPDRRFLGARHLPPEEPPNEEYRRARTGGMIGDIHVTIDGKPDRRFKENRGLSEEEVMAQWVEVLNRRYRQH